MRLECDTMSGAVLGEVVCGATHPLHDLERIWPETSCYVDLWIELLHALGHAPQACLGFCVEQDFEDDQFTFLKPRPEDIEELYGLTVQELAIWDELPDHVATQIGRGRPVLVEVDALYLPDTPGVTYQIGHGKTTIAITEYDRHAPRIRYFHNRGCYVVDGDDATALLPGRVAAPLPPYAEIVKRTAAPLREAALRDAARSLLWRRVARRPTENPVRRYASVFPTHAERLLDRDAAWFHLYAFNVLRQLGAGFELLGTHLRWIDDGHEAAAAVCDDAAGTAKTLQFHLARAVQRRRRPDAAPLVARLADAWDEIHRALPAR